VQLAWNCRSADGILAVIPRTERLLI